MPEKQDSSPLSGGPLRKGRCPRCGKEFQFSTIAQHKSFPFCSNRCRDVDLGNWMTGKYAIPGPPIPPPESEESEMHADGT